MNQNQRKVVAVTLGQLVMYAVLAVGIVQKESTQTALSFMAIAAGVQLLWAPVLYAYYQRKTHREEEKAAQLRKQIEADAPNRALRRALAESIMAAHQAQTR